MRDAFGGGYGGEGQDKDGVGFCGLEERGLRRGYVYPMVHQTRLASSYPPLQFSPGSPNSRASDKSCSDGVVGYITPSQHAAQLDRELITYKS